MHLLGLGPKVTFAADQNGRLPWSHTIVNANRMRRAGRRKKIATIFIIGMMLTCACGWMFAAMGGVKITTGKSSKKKPAVTRQITPTTPASAGGGAGVINVQWVTPTP